MIFRKKKNEHFFFLTVWEGCVEVKRFAFTQNEEVVAHKYIP
jgi:hypothetical protein